MAEETAVENGQISNFERIVTLTLDRVILHTTVHHVLQIAEQLLKINNCSRTHGLKYRRQESETVQCEKSCSNLLIKSCKPSVELCLPSTTAQTPRHLPCMPCHPSSPYENCTPVSAVHCNITQIRKCFDHLLLWTFNHLTAG